MKKKDKDSLDEILKQYSGDNLINILEKIQKLEKGLFPKTLKKASEKLNLPLSQIYSAASFYSYFSFKKEGKNTIKVCNCITCDMKKSKDIIKAIEEEINLSTGQSNDKFSFEKVQCIGCCDKAPAMLLNDEPYEDLTPTKVKEILKKC